jgi:D-serine deaminase-like pyridoxal phosphate-dependent protein
VPKLSQLEMPALLLDPLRMDRNITRMRDRIHRHGLTLRPHVKTNKSIDVTRRLIEHSRGPVTVSTLREAEYFASHGIVDILYAVGITINKLPHVLSLRGRGVQLAIVLDNIEAAAAVVGAAEGARTKLDVMLEIDCDGHRSGLPPESDDLLRVAAALRSGHVNLLGVMTHAGSSYNCTSVDGIRKVAEQERFGAVRAAERLRDAGFPSPVVSVGSTPTATFADEVSGVTEVRAGVFVFFDLVMAGIGVCRLEDIALSVLATVIGHQPEKGWILIDAGWMAMSQDRGTSRQAVSQGYGVVCDISGAAYENLIVADANQEHGIITVRPGSQGVLPQLTIGDRVRIFPNHACSTAAQHPGYHVVRGASQVVEAEWARFGGW